MTVLPLQRASQLFHFRSYLIIFCKWIQRAKGTKHLLSLDNADNQRHWRKETDSLTMELHFGIGAQHTTETRERTDDEKECPRFSEKEGGWAVGKEIKGYVLTVVARSSLAPHSWSILYLPFASSDSLVIGIRVIFFKISEVAVVQVINKCA